MTFGAYFAINHRKIGFILFEKLLKEHGEYKVGQSGQVLLFLGRGPWNDEALKQGSYQLNDVILQINKNQSWGQLSFLSGESILPPSTFKEFVKHTAIRKQLGMRALAVVIKDTDIINTIKSQLGDAYQSAGIEHKFFSEIDEAIDWLVACNIDLEPLQVHAFFKKHAFTPLFDHYQ